MPKAEYIQNKDDFETMWDRIVFNPQPKPKGNPKVQNLCYTKKTLRVGKNKDNYEDKNKLSAQMGGEKHN